MKLPSFRFIVFCDLLSVISWHEVFNYGLIANTSMMFGLMSTSNGQKEVITTYYRELPNCIVGIVFLQISSHDVLFLGDMRDMRAVQGYFLRAIAKVFFLQLNSTFFYTFSNAYIYPHTQKKTLVYG